MKKWIPILAVVGAIALTACKEKKQSNDIIIAKTEVQKPKDPVAMQDYKDTKTVDWVGGEYQVSIHRSAASSLPMVSDDDGQQYVDNTISLTITRQDGSVFFEKTYAKSDFLPYLDASYGRKGILEAMIFERVQGIEMYFAVSVCMPGSDDEFIPLVLVVDSHMNTSIHRDNAIDTSAETEDVG